MIKPNLLDIAKCYKHMACIAHTMLEILRNIQTGFRQGICPTRDIKGVKIWQASKPVKTFINSTDRKDIVLS